MRLRESTAMRIVLLVADNPKRAKTRAFLAFNELRSGMTVAEFLALEGHRAALDARPGWAARELQWGLKKRYLRLDAISAGPPPPPSVAGAAPGTPT